MKKINNKFKVLIAVLLIFATVSSSSLMISSENKKKASSSSKTTVSAAAKSDKSKSHKHSVGAWKVTKKATASENGKQTGTCSGCGKKVTQNIPKITSVTLRYKSGVFNKSELKNTVTVKDAAGNKLKKDKDYTVTYKNNKYVGTAKVYVTFKGKYSGKTTKTFAIVPPTPKVTGTDSGKEKIKLIWQKNKKQTDGYEIGYAITPNFANAKTVRVDKETTKKTIKGLTKGTTYFARIRAYKTVGGKTYYSPWSAYKTIVTKGSPASHGIAYCVPKSARVKPSYFDDAVFVGDSISLKLNFYEAANDVLGKAKFLTAGSLSATNALWEVSDKSVHPRYNGKKMKIEDAVALMGAKKVYIMLGMNDINFVGADKSIENFVTLCKRIKKKSPGVTFYVQSVTPRVAFTSTTTVKSLTNAKINDYNVKLSARCQKEGWYFLNVASVMFDSKGNLKREYCGDPQSMGMHFSNEGCKAWVDYLYTHTA